MKHWFDDLTKELAEGNLSRRSMLRSVLRGGLAAVGAALIGRSASAAQLVSAGAEGQRREGPCSIRQEGQTQILSFSSRSTFKRRPLTLDQTTKILSKGNTTTSKTIKLAGSVLLQIEETKRANSIQIIVNYGAAFQGVKRAVFTSTDGKVLQGQVDNRRLLPFRIGDDPNSAKFADRNPPPELKVESDISEAIKSILTQAKQDAATCSPERPNRAHHADSHHPAALPPQEGEPGHGSFPASSTGCKICTSGCIASGAACAAAGLIGCASAGLFYWLCVASVVASCATTWDLVCVLNCYSAGNPCCPIDCAGRCCESDEKCLDGTSLCCSAGLVPCGGKRCCKPTDTCINATGDCCATGIICNNVCCQKDANGVQAICKDGVVCCPPTQIVCAGVCCKQGVPATGCVNGKCCAVPCGPNTCCDELSKCADSGKGLCCSFAVEVCDGKCCRPGETCFNGVCCANRCGDTCCGPNKVCCGGVCCGDNETCTNPNLKKCAPCPDKRQVGCIPQQPPGSKNDSKSGPGTGICCPPNLSCCNNQCCKSGEICCSRTGLAFGCHPIDECVA